MLAVAKHEHLPVQQAKSGEPDAWNVIFKRYQLPLYVYVFELIGDEQLSLDIVQESFIKAARHIGSLQQDDKFGGWLFGIAHQRCIQQWRKERKRFDEGPLLEEVNESLFDNNSGPDDLLMRQEQEAHFTALLNQLTPPQRSVLVLHFIEDFSLEEIAGITGTQLGTVKSRIHYAKRALKQLLEEKQI